LNVIETCYIGKVPPNELRQAVEATIAEGLLHDAVRYLADCSTLPGGHSLVELFNLLDICSSFPLSIFEKRCCSPN
jgi:hypothetical protein